MDAAPAGGHTSVLRDEVVAAVQPRGGVGWRGLDLTLGAGGHTLALLAASAPDGHVTGLDADPTALDLASGRIAAATEGLETSRFAPVQGNFGDLATLGLAPVDGIVMDLGLSSMQLDQGGRGFSFRGDEPLDMRFDPDGPQPTAGELLATLSEGELVRVLREYGEEPRAARVARSIVQRRARQPLTRTGDLVAAVIVALGPARGRIHPATRTFQALRIAVNDELDVLERGLAAAVDLLRPHGRLAVISFHSLEDRIVKWRFRALAEAGTVRVITRKPLIPSMVEQQQNPRARSAKLRVAEKVA